MLSIELGAIAAPIISAIGVTLLYHYIGKDYLGADENELWNNIRRAILIPVDDIVTNNTDFWGVINNAYSGEFVGTVNLTSNKLAQEFEDAGYVQGILSGLKKREGEHDIQYESGSMVFRESKSDLIPDVLAFYQVHVFWFKNESNSIDVYAHYEYSSANPLVAWWHYIGKGQDYDEGVRRARRVLGRVLNQE